MLEPVFFDPVICHYPICKLDGQCLGAFLLNIHREDKKQSNLGVFLRAVPVLSYLGTVGIA